MDTREQESAAFGLGYVKTATSHLCAVWEFGGSDDTFLYQYSVACASGKYLIDAAFTNNWKFDQNDSTEESDIVAIDDHYTFDGNYYKQSIYFISRFKTAEALLPFNKNYVVEVKDTSSHSYYET